MNNENQNNPPLFTVTMTKIVNYEVLVNAETAPEAMEIANEMEESVLDAHHVVGGEITTDYAEEGTQPVSDCLTCGNAYQWQWEEAFDKFGFNDGDGLIETFRVEDVLSAAGYEVESDQWGYHNVVIFSIKKDGLELILRGERDIGLGYTDPRTYLPEAIIHLLDRELA